MAEQIKGVLFDNDGTLVDTQQLILVSMRHATREVLGRIIPDDVLMAEVGTPLATQMEHLADDPSQAETLLRTYRSYNEHIHDERVRSFDGIAEMLSELKRRGLATGVVTSKMHPLAWRGLEVCGLSGDIDFLIGPDDFPEHKPAPGPVLYGCKLAGLEPEQCLYVGDSPFDIQAGNAARCATVAVMWGMFSRDALEACNPTYVIERPEELLELVAR